jgi:hypothetical protein
VRFRFRVHAWFQRSDRRLLRVVTAGRRNLAALRERYGGALSLLAALVKDASQHSVHSSAGLQLATQAPVDRTPKFALRALNVAMCSLPR